MIIVLMGAPGSGKGTYSQLLVKKGWTHFSMGQALREHAERNGKYAKQIRKFQAAGKLVPEKIFFAIFSEYTHKMRNKKVMLEGMPRNVAQIRGVEKALGKKHPIDAFIYLDISEKEVLTRLKGRQQCEKCGEVYGKNQRPKKKGFCDLDGGRLFTRNDDKPSVIHERFKVYAKATLPVIDWASLHYPVFYIGAQGSPKVVLKRIMHVLTWLK